MYTPCAVFLMIVGSVMCLLFTPFTTYVSLIFFFLDFDPFQKTFTDFMSLFGVSESSSSIVSDLFYLLSVS